VTSSAERRLHAGVALLNLAPGCPCRLLGGDERIERAEPAAVLVAKWVSLDAPAVVAVAARADMDHGVSELGRSASRTWPKPRHRLFLWSILLALRSRHVGISAEALSVTQIQIHGKPVYTFQSHNAALSAWADIRRRRHSQLLLLTFDYHTDVLEAFLRLTFKDLGEPFEHCKLRIQRRLSQVDISDPESVRLAVVELRNDEHIDAAIRLGIFTLAFCFNYRESTLSIEERRYLDGGGWHIGLPQPKQPFTYTVPANQIFEVKETCFVGCPVTPHTDSCIRPFADQAIESTMLRRLIETANTMARAVRLEDVTAVPFVLDIDLDYFRTIASLSPADGSVFHGLIRNAVAITIATEPRFVEALRLDPELTSDYSLARLREHVDKALSR